MRDDPVAYDVSLGGLTWADWLDRLTEITDEDGYVERLGRRHAAILVEEKPTLLVTFESFPGITIRSDKAHPLGWDMHKALGWSHLCLVCNGDTWFRDARVYGYIDRLIDDGFFEDFDQVIFYGAGPCGYAAAAFSVAAPGAQVLVIQPQATLDPRTAEWDHRFREMRRTSFSDRYGYAPDMIEAAREAYVLYDPEVAEDAMHAALFTKPNVTQFRMRHLGDSMEQSLSRMNILLRLLAHVSADKLNRFSLARLFRARRSDSHYQFTLLQHLRQTDRPYLTKLLCEFVLEHRNAPPFRKSLMRARHRLGLDHPE